MATLLGGWIYEGLSTETKPTLLTGALNRQVFKELDTGESYHLRNGVWEFVNLGLSFIKATKSGICTTDANGVYQVVFNTPFINDSYTAALSCADIGADKPPLAFKHSKTTNGFTIQTRDSKKGDPVGNITVSWLATRDYNP